jgi:23S rRNA pseudouridine1911/1915/1917 synthase
MLEFISDTTDRLDKFLASKVDVSRSRVQKAIKEGLVSVDGIIVLDPDYDVIVGNKVILPEFKSQELKPSDIKLKIVYENVDIAVIDKPSGLVVHPGAGNIEDTLSNALLTYFPDIRNVGEPHRPGIVHRLDEDTSGLIIIAKTSVGYDYLKQMFADRKVEKEYLALVHGKVEKLHGVIDLPIAKASAHRKMKVGEAGEGKEAITEYSVVSESPAKGLDQYTLLRVKLHTGRTHQIRLHMQAIGHPLLGDQTYGGTFKTTDLQILDRQFLHAYRLKFQLLDGTWMELESALPTDLKKVLNKLHIKYKN